MKYLLVPFHNAWNASSRPAGTTKLLINVTGPVTACSVVAAMRASEVMLRLMDLASLALSLHICARTAPMYTHGRALVNPTSGGPVVATDEAGGRVRQRRRTRAAIVAAAAGLIRDGKTP